MMRRRLVRCAAVFVLGAALVAGTVGCGDDSAGVMRLAGKWALNSGRQIDTTLLDFGLPSAGEGQPAANVMSFGYSPPGSGSYLGQVTWEQTTSANNRGELTVTAGPSEPTGVIEVGAALTIATELSADGNTLTTVITSASGSQTELWTRVIRQ